MGAGAAQRTDVQPVEIQEVPGPESSESARNFLVVQSNPSNIKKQIKWPAAISLMKMSTKVKGKADRKLQAMTTIIVSITVEWFEPEHLTQTTKEQW